MYNKNNPSNCQENNNYFKDNFTKSINSKANIWKNLKAGSRKVATKFLNSDREREKKRGERIFNCGSQLNYGFDNNDFLKMATYNNSEFEKLHRLSNTLFDISYETTIKSLETLLKANELKQKFKSAHFCKSRLCPICQWRNSLKKRAEMYEILPEIKKDNPTMRFLFLTLTIKNCYMSELKTTIKQLNDGLRKMLKDKRLRFIKGAIKSLEITQGKSEKGTAHPHLHLLLAVSSTYFKGTNYIKYEEWRELWKQYLNIDYDPQINIQSISNDPEKDILRELLKTSLYIEKEQLNSFDEDLFIEYSRQIENSRTYELMGIFKDYRKKRKEGLKQQKEGFLKIDEETGEIVDTELLVNSIIIDYINKEYIYKYDSRLVNRFIKIANNHVELIKAIEDAKRKGLLEIQKELEKQESNEMIAIIQEFMKHNTT